MIDDVVNQGHQECCDDEQPRVSGDPLHKEGEGVDGVSRVENVDEYVLLALEDWLFGLFDEEDHVKQSEQEKHRA